MDKIGYNKKDLINTIRKYGSEPLTPEVVSFLSDCRGAYKAMCLAEEYGPSESKGSEDTPHFSPQMAVEWASGMINSDGTRGPHWSIEKTRELQKQFSIDCDEFKFWVVINSLYSDFKEALSANNASNLETYASLAQAWLNDKDAVPEKVAAYFTHIVQH